MAITREQALTELRRRGQQVPEVQPAAFTREQATAELQRRGVSAQPEIRRGVLTREMAEPAVAPAGITAAGILEPAATLATGALAEPLAGLAGLAKAAFAPSPQEAVKRGTETVKATREALTFQPRTQEGRESLQAISGFIAPVGEALQAAETFLGDETFEATGSPALAAAATTLPTAIIEALGLASAKGIVRGTARTRKLAKSREVKRAVVEAAPEIDQLKNTSRAVFDELDDSGVRIKPETFENLNKTIKRNLKGFRERTAPQTANVLKEFDADVGKTLNFADFDELRTIAQGVARSLDSNESRLGISIIETMDDFLDTISPDNLIKGGLKATDIAPKHRVARELWGRARRSETIMEAFDKAKNSPGGFEKGIVPQLRTILNNKKKAKFFKPEEIKVMQEVVRGTTSSNLAKMIGRFGFSGNIVGGAVGAAGGGAILGTPGAIIIPVIGEVSKKLAGRLTRKGADFADAVVRAGTNADDIAKVYLKNTPKAARKAEELSELLMRPDISLDNLIVSGNKTLKEAAEIARGKKALVAAFGAAELGAIKELPKERNFLDRLKEIPQDQEIDFRMASEQQPTLQPRLSQGLRRINGNQFGR